MEDESHSFLINEARRLRRQGDNKLAEKKLLDLADKGSIDAIVELAHFSLDDDKREESDRWIAKAEDILQPTDLDGRAALISAYTLGLGFADHERREEKALFHLEQLALANNPIAQENLALHFLEGLNGCPKDLNQFERWINSAIESGSISATFIYAQYLLKHKHKIPQKLVDTLLKAENNKEIMKLLQKIKANRYL